MKKILAVIPARFNSSRFPGKPLALISGKPMIWWVYKNALKINNIELIVATDHIDIFNYCIEQKINVLMTSPKHINGTERLTEVSKKINADIYLTLQGDEPIFSVQSVKNLIKDFMRETNPFCSTLMIPYKNPIDLINSTTPKVIFSINKSILYISRSPIPYPKNFLDYKIYKPTGQYVFTKDALDVYSKLKIGPLEKAEDIELLRFIENDYKIKVYETKSNTIAVDTPKDLERVEKIINDSKKNI